MKNNKLVMIPGPTPVTRSIMDQMARETPSFKDATFVNDFKTLVFDLKRHWGAEECFVIAGTGTMAMEISVANSVKSGDNVLIISHGYFGDRFIDIFERRGVSVDVLSSEWGDTVALEAIEKKLKEKKYSAVTLTHVDTSTGVCADVAAIGEMVSSYDETLLIVDGVCASAAEYQNLKEMHIDILFTASQKAFGVAPGLAIVWASEKALGRRREMGTIMDSYMDFEKWLPIMHDPMKYYGTPAINMIWALKESLRLMVEEGFAVRFNRHIKDGNAIRKGLEAIGFSILAKEHCRSVALSNVIYPEGISDADFRAILAEEGVVTAGGLGDWAGKLFRLGHMGNIDKHTVVSTLAGIERAVYRCGGDIVFGTAVGAYLQDVMDPAVSVEEASA